jgi:hypothetical protein
MKLSYPLIVFCVMLPIMPVASLAGSSQAHPEGALLMAMGDDLDDEEDEEEEEASAPPARAEPLAQQPSALSSGSHRNGFVQRQCHHRSRHFVSRPRQAVKRPSSALSHRRRR